ncbi:MAG: DUF21 domain-containing protein, partial [Treponema sp.]|nr:DUF21 domain-containing protein [Treponema sp.]
MQLIGILILLLCLIGASAFFSSSETAFLSITKIQIRQMLKEKIPSAKRISLLKNDMDKVLTTILIGNNFVNNLASSTATALAISLVGEKGVTTATIIMTIVIITFGEILPKTISTYMPEKMAKYFSLPLLILQKIMFPVVWIFSRLTKGVGFIVDKLWKSNTPLITEEELKTLIEVGNAEGTLENNEKEMLYKIFEFTDLRVRDITRHRSFVQGIPAEASYFEAAQLFSKSGYSRLPVYSTNSGKENSTDEYIGLLHYKTL